MSLIGNSLRSLRKEINYIIILYPSSQRIVSKVSQHSNIWMNHEPISQHDDRGILNQSINR